jgi:hypothetical protein
MRLSSVSLDASLGALGEFVPLLFALGLWL